MSRQSLGATLLTLGILSCSPQFSGPGIDQVKQDLVGQKFSIRMSGTNAIGMDDEFIHNTAVTSTAAQGMAVRGRLTDAEAKTDELHVFITQQEGPLTISGVLRVRYKHFQQGWTLQSIEPLEAFSYAAAVLGPKSVDTMSRVPALDQKSGRKASPDPERDAANGADFLGNWTGYYAPNSGAPFETAPYRRLSVTRESTRFRITYTENDGRRWSWLAKYQGGKLLAIGGADAMTGETRTLESSQDGTLREIEEGVIRYEKAR